jgi:predicted dehydrogenase
VTTAVPVRWGVLGTARIALQKVIPGFQRSGRASVLALGSRDAARAASAAAALAVPRSYGSYAGVVDDPDVEAVYIPLPNHLHVEWAARAAASGKHVLCEKPLAMTAAEAERLIEARDRYHVVVQEAFMIRNHPQWLLAMRLVRDGRLGDVRSVVGQFAYFNADPANIRNIREIGGGGLLDIGCYLTHVARWVFDREPARVAGLLARDPESSVDRVTSLLLDFGDGQAIGTCATQLAPYQRVHIHGTKRRLEIEIPFNAPPDSSCRLSLDDGSDLRGAGVEAMAVNIVDQYTAQADAFAAAVRDGAVPTVSLESSIANMRVLDALARSSASGRWEAP